MISMHNWFECKIQSEKTAEDGKQKKVTDTYLVDAMSFTEAEARVIKEVEPYMTGEYTVSNIKRSKIQELFDAIEGDRWYKAKVLFTIIDPDKGREKKVAASMLVQASNIEDALRRLHEGMKGTMSDYEIAMITDTPILDIFPFSADKEVDIIPSES